MMDKQDLSPALLEELKGSRQVFVGRLEEQARQQAWIMAAVHSPHKYSHLASLTSIILASLKVCTVQFTHQGGNFCLTDYIFVEYIYLLSPWKVLVP